MKTYFLVFVFCACFFLHGCGESLPASRFAGAYAMEFPELPPAWESMLGSPCWRVQWLNDKGRMETLTVRENTHVEVSLPPTFASAVFALPFWPDRGLMPGIFRPAGAIFPFDASGKTLVLSWQGGVDAHLFWELARACKTDHAERATVSRLPWNFNWPRFRELFNDPTLNEEVRANPWLADWRAIAEKIIQSGFDKRRLVPEPRSNLQIPVSPGPWISASPFAPPLFFDGPPVFPVTAAAATWVSAEGILRCNSAAWMVVVGEKY
ncbi:MAG: hypothetical protein LBI06_09035 [Treponema sp.]|jgi:hypothetical protein|nr:hypothetical protein [Treponema sp.]